MENAANAFPFVQMPIAEQDVAAPSKTGNPQAQEAEIEKKNKRKEIRFKASHALLIVFFSWILYVCLGCHW